MTNWHQADFALIPSSDAVQNPSESGVPFWQLSDVYRDAHLPSLRGGEKLLVEAAELLETRGAFDVTLVLGKMTRSNLIHEIDRLCASAGPYDCLLFYFSGYGRFLSNDYDDSFALLLAG
jgi:hypothetical protein